MIRLRVGRNFVLVAVPKVVRQVSRADPLRCLVGGASVRMLVSRLAWEACRSITSQKGCLVVSSDVLVVR